MAVCRLSSKGQVTIPQKVRDALGVEPGDTIAYAIRGDVVWLRRVKPFDADFHRALSGTLTEWESPEDEEAFRNLRA